MDSISASSLAPRGAQSSTDSGAAAPTTQTSGAAPNVVAQKSTKTSFFDIFLSEKQIERNQKHARVIATIKAYAGIERELIEINKRLDALISLLDAATGNGTKTLLEAAAEDATRSIVSCNSMISGLANGPAQRLTRDQDRRLTELMDEKEKKYKKLNELRAKTFNFSEDIDKQLKTVDRTNRELELSYSILMQ